MMLSRILGRLSPRAWVARIARDEIYAERRESNLRAVKEFGLWSRDYARSRAPYIGGDLPTGLGTVSNDTGRNEHFLQQDDLGGGA